ncbi:MAG: glycosyltransferase family 4 protein, partial [Calditrichaeota bacterium]|nr:glycosyltransferase family 4 protein [Calditrichota bacterium]
MMSRFKILLIGAIPPPYIGPSLANFNLIRSQLLNKHFHIIHFDTSDTRNSNNIGNFDIGNAWLAIRHIYQFIILLWRSQPDLIYLSISQGLWGIIRDLGFIIPSILTKRKVIIHLRGSEFDCVYQSLPIVIKQVTRWALKRISAAIVLGKSLTYIFEGLVPQDKIHVIPNGIDPLPYKPDRPYEQRKGILFLATLKKRKGIFEFLYALPEVLKKHPEIKITIAGAWRNESEELAAQNLITELSISHAINFVGEVSGHN